jgi:pyruvate dehydrogenase E1 component
VERRGEDAVRADVLSGGYRLLEPPGGSARVILATCGPVIPEVLDAATILHEEGVPALVLDLTSPDRLYRQWRAELLAATRTARSTRPIFHLAELLRPPERRLPIVTVHDAASHHLAWLGGVFGTPVVPVGVDEFGQSGTIADLYRAFDMTAGHIANAAFVVTN